MINEQKGATKEQQTVTPAFFLLGQLPEATTEGQLERFWFMIFQGKITILHIVQLVEKK